MSLLLAGSSNNYGSDKKEKKEKKDKKEKKEKKKEKKESRKRDRSPTPPWLKTDGQMDRYDLIRQQAASGVPGYGAPGIN